MSGMGTHEQTTVNRDHLWVAVVIAACALLEVWATWLGLGSVSGFPKLGRMTTGWVLPVTTEAYWAYALYSWLAGAPGTRSRKFAMWTAGIMFALSLLGQESGHLTSPGDRTAPKVVVALVTALPLIALALVAVLVHLRQADREESAAAVRAAEKAARKAAELRAEADERTALRGEIAGLRAAHAGDLQAAAEDLAAALAARETAEQEAARLSAAEADRDDAVTAREAAEAAREAAEAARAEAEQQAAKAAAEAARLARKLGTPAGGKDAGKGRKTSAAAVPSDFDAHAEALEIYLKDPGISGAELARKTGMSERWGQDRKKEFASRTAENSAAD